MRCPVFRSSACTPFLLSALISLSGPVYPQAMPAPETAAAAAASAPPTPRPPVVVSGVVPDEATRQAILGQVRQLYGTEQVVDRLGVAASSAPPQWGENVRKLITADLKSVHKGHLKVTGNVVDLVGETDSDAQKDKLSRTLTASLNPTYTVNNRLLVVASPQDRIDSVLAGKIIEFESGSAVLTPLGRQVLDALVPVLAGLQGRRMQVIGHTDGSGARIANVQLSQARAEAVRAYLAARGVPADGIQTQGLGPDQPVASNGTAEGRAKNRRIEFKVLP